MLLSLAAILLIGQTAPPAFIGSLPDPLVLPKDVDAADYLAMKVAHHEPDAAAALVRAMQDCGFTIIDRSKKVLYKPDKDSNNGLAVEDRELLAALNTTQDTPSLAFKTLSDALNVLETERQPLDIHSKILDDWRRGMSSSNPGVRFFCHFIDDLSVHGSSPWSINGSSIVMGQVAMPNKPNVLSQTPLVASGAAGLEGMVSQIVQAAVMDVTQKLTDPNISAQERGLVAQQLEPLQKMQLAVMQSTYGPESVAQSQDQRQFGGKPLSTLQAFLIARRMYGDAFVAIPKAPNSGHRIPASHMGDDRDYTGTILDFGGATIGTIFNQAVVTEENFGKVAKAVDVVNTIGAWGKMLATFSNLKILLDPGKVEMSRRKDKQPGTPKNLKLTVTVDFPKTDGGGKTGNLALRTMSWGAGADIAAPDNGPVAGASVTWHLNEDAALFDRAAQWVSPGQAGDGQIKTVALTNNDGEVKIGVQGTPQKEVLLDTSLSYDRKGSITTEVTLKGSNLYQDSVDAMNLVINASTGNGSGVLKTCLPDMLNRSSMLTTRIYPLTIHDWTPPLYEGTFTLDMTGSASRSEDGGSMTWSVSRHLKGGIFSIMKGLSKADALFKQGTGYYYFDIQDLHNVSINDSWTHHYLGGECVKDPIPGTDSFICDSAVAQIDYPYALKGGSLNLKPEHVSGKDQLTVLGKSAFSIPCRYRFSSPTTFESGVQYMNFPIEFSDVLPPRAQVLHGTGTQKIHTSIGGLEGDINAILKWELHPVK